MKRKSIALANEAIDIISDPTYWVRDIINFIKHFLKSTTDTQS